MNILLDEAMDLVCRRAAACVASVMELPAKDHVPMISAIALLVGSLAMSEDDEMSNGDVMGAGRDLIQAYMVRYKEEMEK